MYDETMSRGWYRGILKMGVLTKFSDFSYKMRYSSFSVFTANFHCDGSITTQFTNEIGFISNEEGSICNRSLIDIEIEWLDGHQNEGWCDILHGQESSAWVDLEDENKSFIVRCSPDGEKYCTINSMNSEFVFQTDLYVPSRGEFRSLFDSFQLRNL